MSYGSSDSFLFSNLVGGDRKQLNDQVLTEIEKRLDEFLDAVFEPKGEWITSLVGEWGAIPEVPGGASLAALAPAVGGVGGGGLAAPNAAQLTSMLGVTKYVINSILKKHKFNYGIGTTPAAAAASQYASPSEAKEQIKFLQQVKEKLCKA